MNNDITDNADNADWVVTAISGFQNQLDDVVLEIKYFMELLHWEYKDMAKAMEVPIEKVIKWLGGTFNTIYDIHILSIFRDSIMEYYATQVGSNIMNIGVSPKQTKRSSYC